MTLEDLITMTQQLLAQQVITSEDNTTWYTNRVNAAYRRLCTFQGFVTIPGRKESQKRILRFHELETTSDQTISTGLSSNYITPSATNVYMVTDLYDLTNARWVTRVAVKRMRRLNPAEEGVPIRWTPAGSSSGINYMIHPIPGTSADEISVREYTYVYPTDITTGQSPVIPDVWHEAIAYAAGAEGARLLDWTERTNELENRFLSYIAERKSPYEEADFAGGRRYFHVGVR